MGRYCRAHRGGGGWTKTDCRQVHTLVRPVSSAWGSGSGKTRNVPGPRSAPSERGEYSYLLGAAMMAARMNMYYGAGKIIDKAQSSPVCDCAGGVRWFLRIGLAHDESAWPSREKERTRSRGAGSSLTGEVDAETKDREDVAVKRDLERGWGRRPRIEGPARVGTRRWIN